MFHVEHKENGNKAFRFSLFVVGLFPNMLGSYICRCIESYALLVSTGR